MVKKEIKYLNKDFAQFRENLIEFAKTYFPNTYNDFNESSPGMMIMEMSSYIGDVLSFYTDYQFKESLLNEASGKANIYSIARSLGYQTKNSVAATGELDVYVVIPADGSAEPDYNYAPTILPGMVVTTSKGVQFRTAEFINFKQNTSTSPMEVTVYTVNDVTKEPEYYLLRKTAKIINGNIQTQDFTFSNGKRYDKILISEEERQPQPIIEVLDIIDSDGNEWKEVPYLAQDVILEPVLNAPENDPDLHVYSESAPYLLKPKKHSRRFITRFTSGGGLEIQFGAGIVDISDEELVPNPDNIGSALLGLQKQVDFPIDPSNFVYTKTYGLAPSNTTLTVRYTTGGGISTNVPANSLTEVVSVEWSIDDENLDKPMIETVKRSLAVTNITPCSGGKSAETADEVRQNALAIFAAQQRAVTKEDYLIRSYAMPAKFGAIAKAHVVKDDNINTEVVSKERVPNPLAINLYTLGYTDAGKLTQLNPAIKHNLQNYMKQYRMLTDAVNIKDAFIINIAVYFDVITLPEYNSNEVLLRCINKLREVFDVKKWKIGQPIILPRIYVELDGVTGVQTVKNIRIANLYDTAQGYSGNIYNIEEATKDGIIYTSLDPSIFEVRNFETDIVGKVVTL